MIRLDSISKQNGHQLLFIDASMAVQKGEKDGAGKTTIFRMISGHAALDQHRTVVGLLLTIGYFSQDVGEMSGRTAVEEGVIGVRVDFSRVDFS